MKRSFLWGAAGLLAYAASLSLSAAVEEPQEHRHSEAEASEHSGCSGHDHGETEGHDHAAEAADEHEHEHSEASEHSGCSGHKHGESEGHDHAAEAADEHGHTHAPGESCSGGQAVIVQADAHARALMKMQVEELPAASLRLQSSVYGRLMLTDNAVESYAAPVAGRVLLRVKSAQSVKAGDELFVLQSPALMELLGELKGVRADLLRCSDEIEAMQSRVSRLQSAGARNSDLEEQLKFKQAEQRRLEQSAALAEQRLKMLSYGAELQEQDGMCQLLQRAKQDGVVRNVGVSQQAWLEQGAAVLSMSRPQEMEVVCPLYSGARQDFNTLRAVLDNGREQQVLEGEWRLEEQINPETLTRNLYFTPKALPAGARPGQLCRLDLYSGSAEDGSISIPDSAIVKVGVDDVVFLEIGEGKYAMKKVHAGRSRCGMTPVQGLKAGQRLVVKGGYELKFILPNEGQKKKAGHFHADGKFHEGGEH